MKLQKLLLLGLLGMCVPMMMVTSCGDKPEELPIQEPDHQPDQIGSSFKTCPLLAHAYVGKKLGIKEIMVKQVYYGDTIVTNIYCYNESQVLLEREKKTRGNEQFITYLYDADKRPYKRIKKYLDNEYLSLIESTLRYDSCGFLKERTEVTVDASGIISSNYEILYEYRGDTVFAVDKAETYNQEWVVFSSENVLPICRGYKGVLQYETPEKIYWKDGNLMGKGKDNEWNVIYDTCFNKYSLLVSPFAMVSNFLMNRVTGEDVTYSDFTMYLHAMSKNNLVKGNPFDGGNSSGYSGKKCMYNEKGLVEYELDERGNVITFYNYTYY